MTIEQQNDELRVFNFIPKPYAVITYIKKQQQKDKNKATPLDIKWSYDTIDYPIV